MSDHRSRPLRFERLATGCFVPVSHQLNPDGYYRKSRKVGDHMVSEMFHRFIFRAHHKLDEIPSGLEIDHLCGVRCCCNVNHLQMLPRAEHLEATNRERYALKHCAAQLFWRWTQCSGTELGKQFGVTPSTGCRWIREWRLAKGQPQ